MATLMAILRCESWASPIFPFKQLESIKDLSNWAIEHSPTLLNHCSLLARHQTCAQLSPGFSLPLRYDAPRPLFEDNHRENWHYVLSHNICAGFKEAKALAIQFILEHSRKLASKARGWFSNHLQADISSAKHKLGPWGDFTCLVFRNNVCGRY